MAQGFSSRSVNHIGMGMYGPAGRRSLRSKYVMATLACLMVTLGSQQGAAATQMRAGSSAKTKTLARHTVVRSQGTKMIDVRVPMAATIHTPFGESPDVRVTGAEGFAGFALVSLSRPLAIIGGRLPAAGGHHFALPVSNAPERSGWNFDFVKNYEDTVTIPAGRYRLYSFAEDEDADVTIRISLTGLQGRTVLQPMRSVTGDISSPPARLLGGAGATNNLYSAGASAELSSRGLIFSALWLDHEGFLSGQFDFCHYEGDTEIEPVAYGPGCPNSKQHSLANNRLSDTEGGTKVLMMGKSYLDPNTHGQGFWFAAEGLITDVNYVALWLPHE